MNESINRSINQSISILQPWRPSRKRYPQQLFLQLHFVSCPVRFTMTGHSTKTTQYTAPTNSQSFGQADVCSTAKRWFVVTLRHTAFTRHTNGQRLLCLVRSIYLACLPLANEVQGRMWSCPVHIMKAYRESRGIAPLILNLSTIWRSAVSFTPIE